MPINSNLLYKLCYHIMGESPNRSVYCATVQPQSKQVQTPVVL